MVAQILVTVNLNNMDAIAALEELIAADPRGELHEQLAMNDDCLLETLVVLRKSKGLTQDVVAERMNRSKTAVSNFERLGADPHLSTIRRYAAAVGARIVTTVTDHEQTQAIADTAVTSCGPGLFVYASQRALVPADTSYQHDWTLVA